MKARPYQAAALDEIRSLYAQGTKKVLLWLPTGAGKTFCFCDILKSAHKKGKRAIMVVSGASLVDQASVRLDMQGVPHGVHQANHWRRMPDEPIQICSIHTLYKRKIVPDADLVVIDEAHLAASPSFLWLFDHYKDAFFLPVTATPYLKRGLRHIAEAIVHPISMGELIEQGYLVSARYYIPSKLDLSRVEIDSTTKDYRQSQLAETMKDAALYGDMVDSYRRYAENRPSILFAVNVEHSLEIVDIFNAAGIAAAHIEASTPAAKRTETIQALINGSIKVLSNVGILTTGVDIPAVSCIIMARPTKSYNLYIQALGRGTRPHPGKSDFIVLDHANNIIEHGLIENERKVNLDGVITKPPEEAIVICAECFCAFSPFAVKPRSYSCPKCGHDNRQKKIEEEPRERNVVTDTHAEMVEVKTQEDIQTARIERYIQEQVNRARARGYKPGWVFFRVKDQFGEKVAKKYGGKIKASFISAESRYLGFTDHPGFE